MSWFGALKGPSTSKPTVSPRTAKRNKLQADRLLRAEKRNKLKQQIKSAQEAREEANLAEAELLALDPDIFEGTIDQEVAEDILDDSAEADQAVTMADFDTENANRRRKSYGQARVSKV